MADNLLVSVPCVCGAEIAPLDAVCVNCKVQVSHVLTEELKARLAACHDEYAAARLKIFFARALILSVCVMHLLILFLFTQWHPFARVFIALFVRGTFGLLLVGFFVLSRRFPILAFTIWLLLYPLIAAILLAESQDVLSWVVGGGFGLGIIAMTLFLGLLPSIRARFIMGRFVRTRRR